MRVRFILNGQEVEMETAAHRRLLDVLASPPFRREAYELSTSESHLTRDTSAGSVVQSSPLRCSPVFRAASYTATRPRAGRAPDFPHDPLAE